MRPHDALNPKMPANEAGIRIDPPPSVPMWSGPRPAAAAAEAPPLEPPGDRPSAQGLRVAPKSKLWVTPSHPNVGVFVLPSMMPPAALRRAPLGGAALGTY